MLGNGATFSVTREGTGMQLAQAVSAGATDKASIESVANTASGRANSRFMVKFLSVLTPDLATDH